MVTRSRSVTGVLGGPAEPPFPGSGSVCVYLPGGGCRGSLRCVPDELVPDDAAGLRAANVGLSGLMAARDAEIAVLRAERDAGQEALRNALLRVAAGAPARHGQLELGNAHLEVAGHGSGRVAAARPGAVPSGHRLAAPSGAAAGLVALRALPVRALSRPDALTAGQHLRRANLPGSRHRDQSPGKLHMSLIVAVSTHCSTSFEKQTSTSSLIPARDAAMSLSVGCRLAE
jgi:hypothetical protein